MITLRHRAEAILKAAGWDIPPCPILWSPRPETRLNQGFELFSSQFLARWYCLCVMRTSVDQGSGFPGASLTRSQNHA